MPPPWLVTNFSMQGDANVPSQTFTPSRSQSAQLGARTDTPSVPSLACPVCMGRMWPRKQELQRHMLSHLPSSLYCPFPRCPWRGNRNDNLRTHWQIMHAGFRQAPEPKHSKIYDPAPLVELVLSGQSTIEGAAEMALSVVKTRAQDLGKDD